MIPIPDSRFPIPVPLLGGVRGGFRFPIPDSRFHLKQPSNSALQAHYAFRCLTFLNSKT
ncbi:MAG: hypothetical protein F6J94_10425 [Moorea sp. SIO1F2]|uniref:hypothetical protein n=1 Tax=Moorena TaxID=1155738 RepID=UPI001300F865|nr:MULTISPECIES: hypothetical protein [Moorena]NET82334.1 hypothetical protein [Moorena sp. SIO1F2]